MVKRTKASVFPSGEMLGMALSRPQVICTGLPPGLTRNMSPLSEAPPATYRSEPDGPRLADPEPGVAVAVAAGALVGALDVGRRTGVGRTVGVAVACRSCAIGGKSLASSARILFQ